MSVSIWIHWQFYKFFEDKLPDRSKFYSSLKGECNSEKDYLQTNNVWNMFKIKTMSDYHNLYIKINVWLLGDIFEKFISTCLYCYGLDICRYFSSPVLSLDAMLTMTNIELELIVDTKMYLLKKEWEEVFLTLLKDIVKQITNTFNHIIPMNQANLLCI